MDPVAIIRRASVRLADVAAADASVPVTRYPGWTMLDLVVHTGSVHRRTIATIETRAQERVGRVFPPDEEPATVLPWFGEGATRMADLLEATDPATRVWGFGDGWSVGSWRLRMALETDVHRWDAERSVGEPAPVDPALAAAGIGEFIALWGGVLEVPAGSVLGMRASDTDDTWTLTAGDGGVRAIPGGDAAGVIGPASDLYLWLSTRVPLDALEHRPATRLWDVALRALPDAKR